MTLRARLVAALAVLLAVGMAVYGVGTYRAFAGAERLRLDREIREALPLVERALAAATGRRPSRPGPGPGGGFGRGPGGGPSPRVSAGSYAALVDADGGVIASLQVPGLDAEPDLSALPAAGAPTMLTVGSQEGEQSWRVLVDDRAGGERLILAVPTTALDAALRRLLRIEVVSGLALLVVLAGGSWLVLRAGLRPIEEMAATAGTISSGSLGGRVPTGTGGTEVDTLGRAINGMLDELEGAFAERAATEARLRRFVADASHELRTPLTSIQGYAELFRLGRDSEHVDTDVVVRRIEEESGRMRRLVEDLLTLARLDEPRPVAQDPVDLAVLAADACSDAVAIDPARPVQLHAPHPVPLTGDEAHLRQAASNLVVNALTHTPPGTAIEVRAEHRDGMATLVVRDHGPGLPPDAVARAFDRFWRADAARSGTGTGLGLSIVAAVAAEHGGTATAANHPTGGAVFTLALPTTRDPEHPDAS